MEFFRRRYDKPDGRDLILYGREALSEVGPIRNPKSAVAMNANPHLRWHPLRGEWVAYASHRQDRTFLPPPEYNPLRPSDNPAFPTELPTGNYEVAVFENLFPTFSLNSHSPPNLIVPTLPAKGRCEVIVFSQDPSSSLSQLSLEQIELVVEVWGERYRQLGALEAIKYVMPFENRGVEMGVTLHHPHGQIYAYPFVPPLAERELRNNEKYYAEHKRSLLESLIDNELRDQKRILYHGTEIVAFVPVCARYSYEVWIAPRKRIPSIADLNDVQKKDFVRALKTVLLKYDGLWKRPFPYLMVFHQAPTDSVNCPAFHFHVEFSPPLRSQDKLKYLAGTELGAEVFANDSLPELKASELQKVECSL